MLLVLVGDRPSPPQFSEQGQTRGSVANVERHTLVPVVGEAQEYCDHSIKGCMIVKYMYLTVTGDNFSKLLHHSSFCLRCMGVHVCMSLNNPSTCICPSSHKSKYLYICMHHFILVLGKDAEFLEE